MPSAEQEFSEMNADSELSICIPFYGKPAEIVNQAIASATRAMPPGSELLVLPNGPEAAAELRRAALPDEARAIESERQLSVVGNWNRCLSLSKGALVHILHDDDVVDREFYNAILELRRRFPQAGLYGTGQTSIESAEWTGRSEHADQPFLLQGDDAAVFILEDRRFAVAGVVLSRSIFASKGPFREDFPYSQDEEAYPRWASEGGIAFDPAPLYRKREHGEQTRYSAWRQPDFAASYVRSRVENADKFSPAIVDLAFRSSARRVISVAVSLALDGENDIALRHLDELGRTFPACRRWPRFWLARATARSRLLRKAADLRRRYVVKA
jgi:hypothetical protein